MQILNWLFSVNSNLKKVDRWWNSLSNIDKAYYGSLYYSNLPFTTLSLEQIEKIYHNHK